MNPKIENLWTARSRVTHLCFAPDCDLAFLLSVLLMGRAVLTYNHLPSLPFVLTLGDVGRRKYPRRGPNLKEARP